MAELWWLIETTLGDTPLYYSKTGFCNVADHGERFPSRAAADAVAKGIREPVRVVEHCWGQFDHSPP